MKILEEILKNYIPEQLFERPKQGFGIPLAKWLNNDLNEWANDLLDIKKIKSEGYLNHNIVDKIWKEHQLNLKDNHNKLWPILMFQTWLQENK